MINTTPIMLKTWLPVLDMLITALNVAFCSIVVAAPAPPARGAVVGMLLIVIKKANTPTLKIISATTADIIWSGSINLNFIFLTSFKVFKPFVPLGPIMLKMEVTLYIGIFKKQLINQSILLHIG